MDVSYQENVRAQDYAFGMEILCLAFGFKLADLKAEVFVRLLANPPIQLGSKNDKNKNRRHGYHLEMTKLIVEKIMNVLENQFCKSMECNTDLGSPACEFSDNDSKYTVLDLDKIVQDAMASTGAIVEAKDGAAQAEVEKQ